MKCNCGTNLAAGASDAAFAATAVSHNTTARMTIILTLAGSGSQTRTEPVSCKVALGKKSVLAEPSQFFVALRMHLAKFVGAKTKGPAPYCPQPDVTICFAWQFAGITIRRDYNSLVLFGGLANFSKACNLA